MVATSFGYFAIARMSLPDLPLQANCVRVPVMVGHAEAVWLETEEPLSAERATALLEAARRAFSAPLHCRFGGSRAIRRHGVALRTSTGVDAIDGTGPFTVTLVVTISNPYPAGAQRHAHGDLPFARDGPREHERRDAE